MKIEFDNIFSQIYFEFDRERSDFDKVRLLTNVMAPGAQYTYAFRKYKKTKGREGWNGKVNILGIKFPTGLLPFVVENLWKKARITPTLIDNRPNFSYLSEDITVSLRDYQKESLNRAMQNKFNSLWWPRGVIKIATGGGKTELAVAMYQYVPVQTLFLVHRKDLVYQTIKRFQGYGIEAGILGDGKCDIKPTGITVATVQTIASYIKREKWKELSFLNSIKQVFFDESHLIAASVEKGNLFFKISAMLPNAFMRWGLTATPFMKDSYSNLLLSGATGDLLHEVTSRYLIDRGFLTAPEVRIITVPKFEKVPHGWPDCYDQGIVLNNKRNDIIAKEYFNIPKPCLIMCSRVGHAEILQRKTNLDILTGSDSAEVRAIVVKKLRENKIGGVICTTIFDEGIDIPELRSIILAGAGKSNIKQLQRIGRGLRKAERKNKVVVIDFHDECTRILRDHSNRRRKIWEDEEFIVRRT